MAATRYAINSERALIVLLVLLSTFLLYKEAFHRTAVRGSSEPDGSTIGSSSIHPVSAPTGAEFAIMGMTTRETSYDYYSISHRYRYAAKHHYDLVWDFEPSREKDKKSWDKLNITRDTIQRVLSGEKQYQWVWMLDYDTMIMNSSIKLEDLVDSALTFAEKEGKNRHAVQMILTRDCEPVNAGSMIFRATPWMLDMVEKWRAHRVAFDLGEGDRLDQGALRDMLKNNVFSAADKSVIIPQTWLNSYPEELVCYDPRDKALERPWVRGDFVIHFAGAAWHHKELDDPVGVFMRKYHKLAD